MGDHQSGEYLRTGAPPASSVPYHSEDGRESSSKVAQYHGDSSSLKQTNGLGNGQHHSHKIHKEKVIAIARVWNEVESKRKRTILAGQFPRYLYFVIIYLIALQHQKSAEPYFELRSSLSDLFVTSKYIDPMTKVTKSFEDISTVEDVWNWLENGFLPSFYELYWSNGEPKDDYYRTVLQQQNRIANGFRLTQRRSALNQDCVLSGKYGSFLPYCYSDLGVDALVGAVDTSDFGPYYNKAKYHYMNNYSSGIVDSGYVVELRSTLNDTAKKIAELKADRWIAEATRWVRVDFAVINPSLSLLGQAELIIQLSVAGQARPEFRASIVKTEQYLDTTRDYIQIVLEVLVLVGVLMYIIGDVKDMCMLGVSAYYADPWNVLGSLQMMLFLIDSITWLVIIVDPVRRGLTVDLGPATPNAAQSRDVTRDAITYSGTSPSLAASVFTMRSYFCIQGLTLLATVLRLLKYMMAVSCLSALVETMVLMQGTLVQFGTVIMVSNTAFAYMGYVLFGDNMPEFHTWDQAFFTLFATLLGEGINYAQLYESNPQGAGIFYVPFVCLYSMIIVHLVVALIVEAYQVQQSQRSRPVSGWRQFKDGLFRRFKPLRKYQYGPKGAKRYNPGGGADGVGAKGYYEEPDNEALYEALHDLLDWTLPGAADVEVTADELFLGRPGATGEVVIQGLKAKQLGPDLVDFIFRRFDFCTRWQDPPPAEPEFMDLLRELQRQVRVLTDAHALCQRKLDAVIAGQTM
mmetsp:Transcript_53082/g.110716  ORF Transcript_53082/g.110716 Transcript_53082/m.110716 type:complete len:745 (-) Transcript_53082:132-2366(-)